MININDTIFDIYSTGNVLDIETGDGEYVQRLFAYSEPYTENTVFELNPNDAEIKLPDVLFSTNKEFNLFIWSGDTDGNHSVNTYGCEINTRAYLPEEETEDDDLGDDETIDIEPDEPEESPPEETDEKEGESDGNLDFDEDSIIEEVTPPVDDLEDIPPLDYPEDIPSDDLTEDEELVDGETSNETDIQMPENYDPTGNLGSVIRTYTGTEFEAEVQQYYDYAADNNAFVSQVECEVIAEDERKKYITDIDDGGVTVHADGDASNYLNIDGNSIDIYQNGSKVASYTGDGIEFYVGEGEPMRFEKASGTTYTNEASHISAGNDGATDGSGFVIDAVNFTKSNRCISAIEGYSNVEADPDGPLYSSGVSMNAQSNSTFGLISVEALVGLYKKSVANIRADEILLRGNVLADSIKVGDKTVSLEGHTHTSRESAKSAWFTAENGVTITNRCTYNPIVGLFLLNLVVVLPSANAGTWQKVGVVASGYRPPYLTALNASHNSATSNTNTHGVFAYVNTSGEVYIKRTTSTTSSFTTVISGMYIL